MYSHTHNREILTKKRSAELVAKIPLVTILLQMVELIFQVRSPFGLFIPGFKSARGWVVGEGSTVRLDDPEKVYFVNVWSFSNSPKPTT